MTGKKKVTMILNTGISTRKQNSLVQNYWKSTGTARLKEGDLLTVRELLELLTVQELLNTSDL